jgi:S1-C subfamily serine protease
MSAKSRAMLGLARTWMLRLVALLALLAPASLQADPADISAAARGVVRIVIVEIRGDELIAISHGTGFAVGPERIVTNAHVVREAVEDDDLAIGIVPSDGAESVYGRLVTVSQRNDLALIATTSPMRLPPLTISGNPPSDAGAVTAVGYPMNVDRAQGLSASDIFRAQPPVTSTGFLSGRRSTREFDSLLHTAPIARGSSGGPLLDDCGRVVGVNSFGTESGSADAEFYFAVSNRELLPFLRANEVTPQVNGAPCRSLADLEEEERDRAERAQEAAQAEAAAEERALARRRDEARREIEFAVLAERESGLALAMVLLMAGLAASGLAVHAWHIDLRHNAEVGYALAMLAVLGAGVAWLNRPGVDDIEARLEERLHDEMAAEDRGPIAAAGGELVCVLQPDRSRITGTAAEDVPFDWSPNGCVNGRTQYGLSDGVWTRVFVPGTEAAVSINRFDPQTREYRTERYLLGAVAMTRARTARSEFTAPNCGADEQAAREFGARQATILSLLAERPNERLVYSCGEARN